MSQTLTSAELMEDDSTWRTIFVLLSLKWATLHIVPVLDPSIDGQKLADITTYAVRQLLDVDQYRESLYRGFAGVEETSQQLQEQALSQARFSRPIAIAFSEVENEIGPRFARMLFAVGYLWRRTSWRDLEWFSALSEVNPENHTELKDVRSELAYVQHNNFEMTRLAWQHIGDSDLAFLKSFPLGDDIDQDPAKDAEGVGKTLIKLWTLRTFWTAMFKKLGPAEINKVITACLGGIQPEDPPAGVIDRLSSFPAPSVFIRTPSLPKRFSPS